MINTATAQKATKENSMHEINVTDLYRQLREIVRHERGHELASALLISALQWPRDDSEYENFKLKWTYDSVPFVVGWPKDDVAGKMRKPDYAWEAFLAFVGDPLPFPEGLKRD